MKSKKTFPKGEGGENYFKVEFKDGKFYNRRIMFIGVESTGNAKRKMSLFVYFFRINKVNHHMFDTVFKKVSKSCRN